MDETQFPKIRCSSCKEKKHCAQFNRKGLGYQHECRSCSKLRLKKWYSDNKEKHKRSVKASRKSQVEKNKDFICKYLGDHPCVDCREADIVVLEFDHMYGDKKENVSTMMLNGCSIGAIREEIEKCQVVCANCHKRRTNRRGMFYRSMVTMV